MVITVIVLSVAGCAGSPKSSLAGKSPAFILNAAWSASKTLTSIRTVTEADLGPESSMHLDLRVDRQGDCVGFTSGNEVGPTVTFSLVQVGGRSYLKAPAQFWQGHYGSAVAQRLAGRWTTGKKVAASIPMAVCTGAITTLRNPAAPFSDGTATGAVTASTVDGMGALVIKVEGSVHGNAGSFPYTDTVYVSADDPHYLLRFGDSATTTTFSDFNKPFSVAVPANAVDADTVLP